MDVELIQYAHDDVVHHLVERLGMIIKGRHGRQNHDAHAGQSEHVLEVNFMQRRLAHDQYQPAVFLQDDVGSAVHQLVTIAAGDGGDCAHTAGGYYHTIGKKGPAGKSRALVKGGVVRLG